MSSSKEQNLKKELFSELQKEGFEDDLKKQLRVKLIGKLQAKQKDTQQASSQKVLFKRVVCSMLAEQLSESNCEYTNSVFGIECGYEGNLISRNELMELLALNRKEVSERESILAHILKRKYPFSSTNLQSVEVQTNPQEIGYTIEQKLMMIDQEYRVALNTKENHHKSNVFDRKKLELELAQKSKRELDLFKEFESHKIKVKVSEQWRVRFEDYSAHLNEEFQRKFDQFRKKDRALNDEYVLKNNALHQKREEAENLIRQKVELLEMKNQTVQAERQNLEGAKKEFKSLQKKQTEELSEKIRHYDNLIASINDKIKYEVGLNKLSVQQEYQEKEAESLRRKKVIDEEYGRLMGIKDTVDVVERENARLSAENNRLREQLTLVEAELRASVSELASKVERIEVLKDELLGAQGAKAEAEARLREEKAKCRRYESEILGIRGELDQIRAKIEVYEGRSFDNDSSVSPDPQRGTGATDIGRKLELLKRQRQKDIEKLKFGDK